MSKADKSPREGGRILAEQAALIGNLNRRAIELEQGHVMLLSRLEKLEKNFHQWAIDELVETQRRGDEIRFWIIFLAGLALGLWLGRRLLEMEVEE